MTDSVATAPFRFQNQRAILTYRTHLPKDEYINWLRHACSKEISFIRLAHETGDAECPYEHTHVIVAWVSAFQTRNARFFDFQDIHPHIKTLNSAKALDDAKHYISKEDPDNSDLKKRSIVNSIQSMDSLEEAIDHFAGADIKNTNSVISIWNLKKPEVVFNWVPTAPWQEDIIALNDIPADCRSVYWYYDPIGNTGKTSLCKFMKLSFGNNWFCSKDMGTSRDAATIIQGAVASGWNGKGWVLDLPRSAEHHTRMYSYIEEILDGMVTAQKYQGGTVIFNSPHLVVFANWLPNIDCLSKDRWKIYDISQQRLLTLKEVIALQINTEVLIK